MPLEKSLGDKSLVSQTVIRESRSKCKRNRRRDRFESRDSTVSTSGSESGRSGSSQSSSSRSSKRRHSSEKTQRSRKGAGSSKKEKKRKRSTSSDSSSSPPAKLKKKKEKKKGRKHKKEKKKKKKKEEKMKEKKNSKSVAADVKSPAETPVKPKPTEGLTVGPAPRVMKPMTKEEWEKQQSVMRYVYDEETGRNRLIKGDGEIMEEIVTRGRHNEINKLATKGDGNFFASRMGLR